MACGNFVPPFPSLLAWCYGDHVERDGGNLTTVSSSGQLLGTLFGIDDV
jgi:hypothetical protein